MNAVQKRIEWVDTGKYVCIMFVMLSHLQSGSEALAKVYTPFFLSGFFFLSGYVYRQEPSFRQHLQKKVRGLLWPWFVLSNGNILLSMVLNHKEDVDYLARFGWNLLQIRTLGDELWFVAALFMAYIPFYFFAGSRRPAVALGIMAGLNLLSQLYRHWMPDDWFPWGLNMLPWHLEFVFQAGFWMLVGYDFRRYGEEEFDRWNTWVNRLGLLLVYLVVTLGPEDLLWLQRLREVPVLTEALGVAGLVSVCKAVKANRYIRFVGANTLVYFAFHGWVYATVELVLQRFAGGFYQAWLESSFGSSLLAVAITLVVSVVLILPAMVVNRWFPWVLGRKRVKNAV